MKMKLSALLGALAYCYASCAFAVPLSLVDEGVTTLDPNTGLRWLDLNLTFGLSYNQTLTTSYVTNLGYRFATEAELRSLYLSVGITFPPGAQSISSPGIIPGVSILLSLLGCTEQCIIGAPAGQAWLDIGSATDTAYAFFQLSQDHAEATLAWGPASRDATIGQGTGSFLVQTTPIPAALPLFATGLGALGLFGWRRKRKLAA